MEGGEENMVGETGIMETVGEVAEEETEATLGRGPGEEAGVGLTPERRGGRGAGVTPGEGETGVGARTGPEARVRHAIYYHNSIIDITEKIMYRESWEGI